MLFEIHKIQVNKANSSLKMLTPFFCIHPPPELLPVLGPLERYMMPTFDAALLYSYREGSDLGQMLDRFEKLCQISTIYESLESISVIFVIMYLSNYYEAPRFR